MVAYKDMIVGRMYRGCEDNIYVKRNDIRIKHHNGDVLNEHGEIMCDSLNSDIVYNGDQFILVDDDKLVVKISPQGEVLECPEGVKVEIVQPTNYSDLIKGDRFTFKYDNPGGYIFTKIGALNNGHIDQFHNWYNVVAKPYHCEVIRVEQKAAS